MSAQAMTLERFKALVEAYGADERAWPQADRASAAALCVTSADARALRLEAAALDAELAKAEWPVPDAALEARIQASFRPHARHSPGSRRMWVRAGALAACLVLSVMAGWAILRTSHQQVDLNDPAAWDLIGEDLEFPTSKS